ncbi:hypothetical protein [Streptomyces sp. V4I2]|uniref:hypothetical protein n=1 Tax=Streptomyces sp. V4I2 TaxID=3042280 RepID=UPI00277DB774|nr:hypothetical protein [Streptomyces sp. V4I2]MDQ1046894.1 hypothetical protein [Streptomyces sp. V4I2]
MCDGWGIVPKLTMTGWPPGVGGGAVVLSLDQLPEVLDWSHLLGSGTAHGGFVPLLS